MLPATRALLVLGLLTPALLRADGPTAEERKLTLAAESKRATVKIDDESTRSPRLTVSYDTPKDADIEPLRNSGLVSSLVVYDASKLTEKGFAVIKSLSELEKLSLGKSKPTAAALAGLKQIKGLKSLYLGESKIGDAGATALKDLEALKELDLSKTEVGDKGLLSLKSLERLQTLNVAGTKITDEGVKGLTELAALRYLNVQNTKVTVTTIKSLEDAMPGIKIMR